jgi:hypothetical protein
MPIQDILKREFIESDFIEAIELAFMAQRFTQNTAAASKKEIPCM